ncbi:exoglucanase 1 [Plectosphaerella plurivora]|uniref:Glucanase n=1 Tax=Plectosphaerella plurivora TaxID=936078 RepID=A0A9P8V4W7_9PEZI|nr:exoglucanase 1 [Plectosphaerella plurivora]
MHRSSIPIVALLAALANAQWPGVNIAENHPPLSWKQCGSNGQCNTVGGEVVLDANWRWLPEVNGFRSCYTGQEWNDDVCPRKPIDACQCALEGADYAGMHGITSSKDALTLRYATQSQFGTTRNSRVYLMESPTLYKTFTLADNEVAFDVDLSAVGCGLNSKLFFVAMDQDGGKAAYPTNRAGAKYGTGYCDATCTRSQRYVAGRASRPWCFPNHVHWYPTQSDPNGGSGQYGACCSEIDVWNSNAHSYSMSTKLCQVNGYHRCDNEIDCGDGERIVRCSRDGCDYSPYRLGQTEFYGQGKTVDTTQPFTVVTRFTDEQTTQFFVQNGQKIETPAPAIPGLSNVSGLNADYCLNVANELNTWQDTFNRVGGFQRHKAVLHQPLVMALAITDDHYAWNVWLDAVYPPAEEGYPGSQRGPCTWTDNDPSKNQDKWKNAKVVWKNIRFGPIGSTVDV